MQDFSDITQFLSKADRAINEDKSLFMAYENKHISLAMCIIGFKKHNGINMKYVINERLFLAWLESLGYRTHD